MSRHKRPLVDQRLAKIEGHVTAIRKMLLDGRPYPEITHQISAVRSSLDAVIDVIVSDLVEDCVATARKGGSVKDAVLELQEVVSKLR